MAVPSCRYFSICPSAAAPTFVSTIGGASHKLLHRKALTKAIKKKLFTDSMGIGYGKCTSGFGFHGISVRCAGASEESKSKGFFLREHALCLALAATIVTMQPSIAPVYASPSGPVLPDLSVLISGPPVKDPKALLRYALPIDNKPMREVQKSLEDITENLKVPGLKALDPVERV